MKLAALSLIMILCVRNLQHRAAAISLNPQYLSESTPTVPVTPLSREDAHAMIRAAALKHNVPAAFVKSIVAAESNFDAAAVSARGAIGLMQLMPELAMEYGVDPRIPEQNIDGGTRYLGVLIHRYQRSRDWLRRTIAAYNAGPGMVDKYRGVPPFRETRNYVARVLGYLRQFEKEG
jgi:soluble lytic murein transglycosylase-like protein